jgi:long-chain acyl-CoA synthetase
MYESIVHALESVADKYPAKIAIADANHGHTYHDLWSEIRACAHYLTELNIKSGQRVAIVLSNSFQYIVVYYGVLFCGGVVVALNTSASPGDISNWYKHCGASLLISETDLVKDASLINFTGFLEPVILNSANDTMSNDYWKNKISDPRFKLEINEPAASAAASIIYTSGTTGNPKGVTLTHGNLASNIYEIIKYLNLSKNDSIINILPFFYSYGNSIMHTHLLSGATIFLENSFMYPVKILQKIADTRATGFSGVPATYSILLSRTNMMEYELSSLRYITQAGGAMPPSNIQKLQKLLPHVNIYIMYGQTEATARITYLEPSMLNSKMGSIGKPLHGLIVEIRDNLGLKLDAGVEGQLYVSGPSIMKGYWGDESLTSSVMDNGFLRTGDIGYMDSDGYIYLTGRLSDMIKVGGNRISPLEVEEIITRLDGIEEVAASGVDDEMLGQVVKVTVVRSADSHITEMQIKAFCRQQLAQYKIPKFIEFVEQLPKTSSGKVKRYLL